MTTQSQRVLRRAGQNCGKSVKTYAQLARPRHSGGLRPSYFMKEK